MKNNKILALTAFLAALLISNAILLVHTGNENRRLKESLSKLDGLSTQQQSIIEQKSKEITEYKEKEKNFIEKAEDFTAKYKEMLEKYLSGKAAGTSSSIDSGNTIKAVGNSGNSLTAGSALSSTGNSGGSVTGSGNSSTGRTDSDRTSIASRSGDASLRSFSSEIGELGEILKNMHVSYGSDQTVETEINEAEKKLEQLFDNVPASWPCSGSVSSSYGYRTDPFTGKKTFHDGLDIAAPHGSDIKAAADGKVVTAGNVSGYGYAVFIDHGNGLTTIYGHCSKLLVKAGQSVKKGQTIAKVGSTGRSTGPHLHYEIRLNGKTVNPMKYLPDK